MVDLQFFAFCPLQRETSAKRTSHFRRMMMLNSASASNCQSSPSRNCWTRYIAEPDKYVNKHHKRVVLRLQNLWSRKESLATAV